METALPACYNLDLEGLPLGNKRVVQSLASLPTRVPVSMIFMAFVH